MADLIVWEGDDSDVFLLGTNWVGNSVPDDTEIAHLDGALDNNCTIDEDIQVHGIQVDAGYNATFDLDGEGGDPPTITIGLSGFVVADGTAVVEQGRAYPRVSGDIDIDEWTDGVGSGMLVGTGDQTVASGVDIGEWGINKRTSGKVTIATAILELGSIDYLIGDGSEALVVTNSTITSTADPKNFVGAGANQADVNFSDAGNDISLGSAIWTITNGAFNWLNCGTWNAETSTIILDGTCTVTADSGKSLYKFATASGSLISIDAATDRHFEISNEADIDGTVTVAAAADEIRIGSSAKLLVRSGAVINGPGKIDLAHPTTGYGLTTLETGATLNVPVHVDASSGTPLAAGIYGGNTYGLVQLQRRINNPGAVSLADGNYQFTKGLYLYSSHPTGTLTVETHTNGTDEIQVSDLTLDETNGTLVVSSSGQLCNWIIVGDVAGGGSPTWTKGTGSITASNPIVKLDGCFEFNGLSDEVDINAQLHNFSTDFTIAAWIRLPTVTSAVGRHIFHQGANCQLFVWTNGLLAYRSGGVSTNTSTSVFTANTWHHVMVTYDNSGTDVIKVYVDNVEEKTQDRTVVNTVTDSRIGSYGGTQYWFPGHIDDVRIFDKALSEAERAALYNEGTGTTAAVAAGNCLAWYKLDDFLADTNVIDSSGNGNTGTATQNTNVMSPTPRDWDWSAITGTLEDIVVNTTHGTLTFSGGFTTVSFFAQQGIIDFNAQTIITTGLFQMAGIASITNAVDAMNGTDLTVGGVFAPSGQDFQSNGGGWLLTCNGGSAANSCVFEECDASGGDEVWAFNCTDGTGNTNFRFQTLTSQHTRSSIGIAI